MLIAKGSKLALILVYQSESHTSNFCNGLVDFEPQLVQID